MKPETNATTEASAVQPGDLPADQRRYQQVAGPAEQRDPGALGDRIELRLRRHRRRDVTVVIVIKVHREFEVARTAELP